MRRPLRALAALAACALLPQIATAAPGDYAAERGSRLLQQGTAPAGDAQVEIRDILLRPRSGEIVRWVPRGDAAGSPADPRQLSLRELLDAGIESRLGDRVGSVQEVVFDMSRRRVDYLVVRFDEGWLGTPKRVAVPFSALLRPGAQPRSWVLDADPARAISLPEFQREHLRRVNDRAVVEQVHRMLDESPWRRPSHSGLELQRQ